MTWANGHWVGEDVKAWVTSPDWHWLTPCDRCGKRQVWLYDVYPEDLGNFQWVCSRCLIIVISALATKLLHRDG